MRHIKILPLLFFLLLSGCTDTLVRDNAPVEIVLDEEFKLGVGESAIFPAKFLSIRFIRLESDGRCPIGVSCIWAGNGKIIIEIDNEKQDLNTTLDPLSLDFRGLKVKLTSLTPFPVSGYNFDKSDYVAGITVSDESEE